MTTTVPLSVLSPTVAMTTVSSRAVRNLPAGSFAVVSVTSHGGGTTVLLRSIDGQEHEISMAGSPDHRGARSVLSMFSKASSVSIQRGPTAVECVAHGDSRGRLTSVPVSLAEALALCAEGVDGWIVEGLAI